MIDWNDILARHGPSVWRRADRLLGHADDADECLQDVFLAAFELSRRETIRDWPALLAMLTTSRCMDRLRRRIRGQSALRVVADDQPPPIPLPEAALEAEELADRLREALTLLPPEQAEAFCLCSIMDLPHRDVAEQLGITPGAVTVRLHRARCRLRELLAREPADRLAMRCRNDS